MIAQGLTDVFNATLALATTITLLGVIWLLREYRAAVTRNGRLTVPMLLAFSYLLHYSVGAQFTYWWPLFDFERTELNGMVLTSALNLDVGFLAILIGGIGWLLGSRLKFDLQGRNHEGGAGTARLHITRRGVIILLSFGHILKLFLVPVLPASITQLAWVPATIVHPLTIYAAYMIGAGRGAERRAWYWIFMASAVAMAAGVLSDGMRAHLLEPIAYGLLGFTAGNRRLPSLAVVMAATVAFLIMLPILNEVKQQIMTSAEAGSEGVLTAIRSQDESSLEKSGVVAVGFVSRLNLSAFACRYAEYYPNLIPYINGETFKVELANFVPRFMWDDKPQLSPTLNAYAREVRIANTEQTSAVFDAFSEYYINYGYLGVLILSMLTPLYYRGWHSAINHVLGTELTIAVVASMILTNHDNFGLILVFDTHIKQLFVWWGIVQVSRLAFGTLMFNRTLDRFRVGFGT